MKNLIWGILLLCLNSCIEKDKNGVNSVSKTIPFFDPVTLGSSGVDASLNITATFSECGEWGGHRENLRIYVKPSDKKNYYLDYLKTNINCDERDEKGYNIEKIVVQKTIKLNDSNKTSITEYIKRTIDSKVEERFPGNAGNSFSIMNSDSTLVIKVYDSNTKNLKSYNQLLQRLKL
jgi:hypothetical protein